MWNSSTELVLFMLNSTITSTVTTIVNSNKIFSDAFVLHSRNISTSLMILIAFPGIFGNIINIFVFSKLGFKESINVSLCALSVSDLAVCVLSLGGSLGLIPIFEQLTPTVALYEVLYSTINWPRYVFIKITKSLTAFVTFERCLCVVMPMKIKLIFTTTRVKLVVISIFVFVACFHTPMFYTSQLGWKWKVNNNVTTRVFGLVGVKDRYDIDRSFFFVNLGFFSAFLFPFIVVCTLVLSRTLQRKSNWRKKASATNTNQKEGLSNKDQKAAKLVVLISSIFIGCSIPDTVLSFVLLIGQDFTIYGKYHQITDLIFLFGAVFTVLNSAVNIFVYYFNGSRYREMFTQTFASKKTG